MKRPAPKPKVEQVQFWSCLDLNHRHRTTAAAEKCIAVHCARLEKMKQEGGGYRVVTPQEYRQARWGTVIRCREDHGMTFKQAGEFMGISGGRAQSLYWQAKRFQRLAEQRGSTS